MQDVTDVYYPVPFLLVCVFCRLLLGRTAAWYSVSWKWSPVSFPDGIVEYATPSLCLPYALFPAHWLCLNVSGTCWEYLLSWLLLEILHPWVCSWFAPLLHWGLHPEIPLQSSLLFLSISSYLQFSFFPLLFFSSVSSVCISLTCFIFIPNTHAWHTLSSFLHCLFSSATM